MKNPLNIKKLLGVVLVLTLVVGAFSMFAVGTSAAETTKCVHELGTEAITNVTTENGQLYGTAKCKKCEETVKVALKDNFPSNPITKTNGNVTVDNTNGKIVIPSATSAQFAFYAPPTNLMGSSAENYQIDFTLKLDAVNTSSNMVNSGNGRNVFNFGTIYTSFIRQYAAEGTGESQTVQLKIQGSSSLISLKVGESANFSILVLPSANTVKVYCNNEYKGEVKNGGFANQTEFRFGDGNTHGWTITNFRNYTVTHVHSDEVATDAALTLGTDNTIKREYTCYCGNKVTEGIKTIVSDNITPAYGITKTSAIANSFTPKKGSVFAGALAVGEIPEAKTTLVSAGTTALVEIDADGKFCVGATTSEITAQTGTYYTFAVYFDGAGNALVYLDGSYVGKVALSATAFDLVVGTDDGIKTFFDSMAVAELGEGGKLSYGVVAGCTHSFDPTKAELSFNDERTKITIDYVCTTCGRNGTLGINKNIFDDPKTGYVEGIQNVTTKNTKGAVTLLEGLNGSYGSYWFSTDVVISQYAGRDKQPLLSIGENALVLVDKDGTLRSADGSTTIGKSKQYVQFNLAFYAVIDESTATKFNVYIDGKYAYTASVIVSEDKIKLGCDYDTSINAVNSKLFTMSADGDLEIEQYQCQFHTYDYKYAKISYIERETFTVTNRCSVCGLTIVEKPVHDFYKDAVTDIYNYGYIYNDPYYLDDDPAWTEEMEALYHSYWIVADVNIRDDSIGSFSGNLNLIGEFGDSYVSISNTKKLILGNGTDTWRWLDSRSTTNIAIQVVIYENDEYVNVYLDGEYVGGFRCKDIVNTYSYTPDEGYGDNGVTFGANGLENVKFCNIKSFVALSKGNNVTFEFAESDAEAACPHIIGSAEYASIVELGSPMKFYFTCPSCGERVYTGYDRDLYDASLNSSFTFTNGVKRIGDTTLLNSTSDLIGATNGVNYWLNFKFDLISVNPDGVGANNNNNGGGRNFLNFMSNYESPLRLFAISDPNGGYKQDRLLITSNKSITATEVGTIVVGNTYEVSLFVRSTENMVDIYFNGQFITTRANAIQSGTSQIRILDGNWLTMDLYDFEFVTCGAFAHEHTDKWSEYYGVTPVLKYGDTTLTYTYMCNCGELVTEGISKVYAEPIEDMIGITSSKTIEAAESAKMSAEPYWVSAKVYYKGSDATVYSYGDNFKVRIEGGNYIVSNDLGIHGDEGQCPASVVGDYDVVSLYVIPAEDKIVVFINGYSFTWFNETVADTENFAFKLGGEGDLDFKNIKIVSLAEDENKEVALVACVHTFDRVNGLDAKVTSTGIDYVCGACGATVRTVTIGDGAKLVKSDKLSAAAQVWLFDANTFSGYRDTIFSKDLDGTFFITYDVKINSLGQSSPKSWVTITYGSSYEHMLSIYKEGDEYTIGLGRTREKTSATVEVGKTYNFVFEVDSKNNCFYAYLNGKYIGKGTTYFDGGAGVAENFRVCDNGTGSFEYTNFQMFKPESTKDFDADTTVKVVHSHFPDLTKTESQTITVKNGVISQKFVCTCGETVELNVMNNIVGDLASKYTNVSGKQFVYVTDELSYGTGTFVISTDFTVNSINLDAITANNCNDGNGRSLLAVADLKNNIYTHLLRAFGHAYVDDNEGYTDANGDGYADGVIDIRCGMGLDPVSNPIIKTLKVGDSVNFTYVVNPSDALKVALYVDGVYVTSYDATKLTSNDLCIRILDGAWGTYSFDNVRLVRMTDGCAAHTEASCTKGDTVTCEHCGFELEATHNYKATTDKTGMWTKYTCEDCGKFYVVFNKSSLVADLDFVNKNAMLEYLIATYFPIF